MATTLTVRDVPTALHQRLQRRAEAHRRSLDREVVALLEHPSRSVEVRHAADRDNEWCAPPLWRSEFCNALMQYVHSDDESIPGTDVTLGGAIERVSAAEAVLRLADRSGCSPYDCEYVQLDDNLNTRLLTYDEPVLEAFPEIAFRPDDVTADA
jgi:hypothetical protein